MSNAKPARRMTLRQLLTYSEKAARDLIEQIQSSLLNQLSDFRDLSRPVRRRSHYPAMIAVHNALRKVSQSAGESLGQASDLLEHLDEIYEHAKRERASRF
jgi:hypothetical protein